MTKKRTAAATSDHTKVVAKLIADYTVAIRKEVLAILYTIVSDKLPPGTDVAGLEPGINSLADRVQKVAIVALVKLMVDPQFRESLHADRARSLAMKKSRLSEPLRNAIRSALLSQPRLSAKHIIKQLEESSGGTLTPRADGKPIKTSTLISIISRIRKTLHDT